MHVNIRFSIFPYFFFVNIFIWIFINNMDSKSPKMTKKKIDFVLSRQYESLLVLVWQNYQKTIVYFKIIDRQSHKSQIHITRNRKYNADLFCWMTFLSIAYALANHTAFLVNQESENEYSKISNLKSDIICV